MFLNPKPQTLDQVSTAEDAILLEAQPLNPKPQTLNQVSTAEDAILLGASDGLETPLHFAVRYGANVALRSLINAGADPTKLNAAGLNPCRLAAKVDDKPQTPNPKPQTPNPRCAIPRRSSIQTLNPKP
jgi:ankyrin repeat protein